MQSVLHHGCAERHQYRDSNRCCARQPPRSGATVAIEITIPQLLFVSILVNAPGKIGQFVHAVGAARGKAAQGVSHVGASGIVGNVGVEVAGRQTLAAGGFTDFLVARETSQRNGKQQFALGNVKEALQVGYRYRRSIRSRVTGVAEEVSDEIVRRRILLVGRYSSSLERQNESRSHQAENCGKLHAGRL